MKTKRFRRGVATLFGGVVAIEARIGDQNAYIDATDAFCRVVSPDELKRIAATFAEAARRIRSGKRKRRPPVRIDRDFWAMTMRETQIAGRWVYGRGVWLDLGTHRRFLVQDGLEGASARDYPPRDLPWLAIGRALRLGARKQRAT